MCLLEGQRERHCTPDWREACDLQEYTAICSILKMRRREAEAFRKDVQTTVDFMKCLLFNYKLQVRRKLSSLLIAYHDGQSLGFVLFACVYV